MVRVKLILIVLLLLLICFFVKKCNSINNNMENFFSLEQDAINLYTGFPSSQEIYDLEKKISNLKRSPIYNITYNDIEEKLKLIYGEEPFLSQTTIEEVQNNIDSLVLDFNNIKYEINHYNVILSSLEQKTGTSKFLNPIDTKKKEIKEAKLNLVEKFQEIKTKVDEIEKQNQSYVDKYTKTLVIHVNKYKEDLTKSKKALEDLIKKLNLLDPNDIIKSLPLKRWAYDYQNRKTLIGQFPTNQYSQILDKTIIELKALIDKAPEKDYLVNTEYTVKALMGIYKSTIIALGDMLTELTYYLSNPTEVIYDPDKIGFIDNNKQNSLVEALYFWMSLKIGSPEYFVINKINSNCNPYVLPETTQDKTYPYKITGSCNAKESISNTPNTTVPPSNTTVPPSNTTVPPSNTTVPPSNTTVPPSNTTVPQTTPTNYKLLFNSIFTPIRDDINQIQKSYNNYQFVSPTTTNSTVSDLKNEKEEEEAKHQVLLNKITELESALKKELEKGEDWDISIISSLEESLNNQTEKLVKLAEINNITDSNNKYATELNAIKTKLHESQELLKSQTSKVEELLKQPKSPKTVSEINRLKKSIINVEQLIETETSSLSNTVTKTRNKYYKSKNKTILPIKSNNHHEKLNNIIESLNKLHIKSMDKKMFTKLNKDYNNLNNLDKNQLLGLLTSILEIKVEKNNSKDIENIVSYTNKLIESKSNLNNYNKTGREILIMEISKALRKGTLTRISEKDRKLLLSNLNYDNKLWKQILKLNDKYSEPTYNNNEKHIDGFFHIHPDNW